jgi:hypothetical protein
MNKSLKICRICGGIEGKDSISFEKHRKVCRECRNKYHKNRREDLSDGKRDDANWYKAEEEMTNERMIKKLEKLHKGSTNVFNIPNHTLRDTSHDSAQESRYIAYVFIVIYAIILYIVITSIAGSSHVTI